MKSMRTIALAVLAVLCVAPARASVAADTLGRDGGLPVRVARVRHAIDSMLNRRDTRDSARVDTTYLRRAPERLRLKVRINCSGSDIDTRGVYGGAPYEARLEAKLRTTLSFGASYRGLSVGVALNPAKLTGEDRDYELNLNAYGNRCGADVILQSSKTYEGTLGGGVGDRDVPVGSVSQDMLTVNAYYVFSGRSFSFPAAFTQSWLQLRSSGSFMLGLTLMGGRLKSAQGADGLSGERTLGIICAGIGAGYGYNWVVGGKWLLHLSTLPELVVFSRSRLTTPGGREKMPYRFPNVIAVGRMAVVRHFDRYFVGMTAVVNTSHLDDSRQLSVGNTKWRARMFVGVKL